MPSHPLEQLVDTVGAGDTFMASMLVWLSQHVKLDNLGSLTLSQKKEMQTYAGQAAARNCERHGCNPPWSNELIS
jgi:fructokinase